MVKIKDSQKKAFWSYTRSVLGTVLAVVLAGETNSKAIWAAFVAAAVPPVLRWINPNDPEFGRVK